MFNYDLDEDDEPYMMKEMKIHHLHHLLLFFGFFCFLGFSLVFYYFLNKKR